MIAFNKYYNQFNILSISLVVISLFLLTFKGLNFGIDFKGGTLIELRSTDSKINVSSLRDNLNSMNLGDVSVKNFGNNKDFLIKFENNLKAMINLYNIQKFGRYGKPMEDKANLVNPCFSGETLIATADGRGYVSIKQLADEGKDIPLYSMNEVTGEVSIQWGRHPRITGENQKLLRIHFGDSNKGEFLDVTPNHKFFLNDGNIIEAKDLFRENYQNQEIIHMIINKYYKEQQII